MGRMPRGMVAFCAPLTELKTAGLKTAEDAELKTAEDTEDAEDFVFLYCSDVTLALEGVCFSFLEDTVLLLIFDFLFSASSVSSAVFIPAVFLRTRASDSASQASFALPRGAALRSLSHSADFPSPAISAMELWVSTE